MGYSDKLIGRYKHLRSMRELDKVYACEYALVGFGSHCTANLLPAIQHLQLPLKYVCCTSERKAALISRKYGGIKGTTSLQDLLNDKSIAGVFVSKLQAKSSKPARLYSSKNHLVRPKTN